MKEPTSPLLPPYYVETEDIPSIDAPDITSAKISVVEGKDGEVELIVDNEGPVLFSLLEETDIEGVKHLTDARHSTRFMLLSLFVSLIGLRSVKLQIRGHGGICTRVHACISPPPISFELDIIIVLDRKRDHNSSTLMVPPSFQTKLL